MLEKRFDCLVERKPGQPTERERKREHVESNPKTQKKTLNIPYRKRKHITLYALHIHRACVYITNAFQNPNCRNSGITCIFWIFIIIHIKWTKNWLTLGNERAKNKTNQKPNGCCVLMEVRIHSKQSINSVFLHGNIAYFH